MALWQVVSLLALFLPGFSRGFELIAHRGVHQTYSRAGLDDRTCTASRIYPPQHSRFEAQASAAVSFGTGSTV